jgi:hypothetical protein
MPLLTAEATIKPMHDFDRPHGCIIACKQEIAPEKPADIRSLKSIGPKRLRTCRLLDSTCAGYVINSRVPDIGIFGAHFLPANTPP